MNTIGEYETARALAGIKSVFTKVCHVCRGIGVSGQDVDGVFISGGICRNCGGTGFAQYVVIDGGKK